MTNELKVAIDKILLDLKSLLKNIESTLMKITQFYIKVDFPYLREELEIRRKNVEDLKNLINIYRIPHIILKEKRNDENLINQIKVVLFYFELILIEVKNSNDIFLKAFEQVDNEKYINAKLIQFSEKFFLIKNLYGQLQEFGNFNDFDNIFDRILLKIEELYQDEKELEKTKKIVEKINFNHIEKNLIHINRNASGDSLVAKFLKKNYN